jgi:hypothetical protein
MSEPTKGYVIVASRKKFFYVSAINLMESIKDYYPEAQITFVVEEKFLDGQERIADNVIFCDDHARAKLIGMAKSPYDITFYVDADIECEHEDIATIFDKLDGHDLMFDWYDLTVAQYGKVWWPTLEDGVTEDLENYPATLKRWDQFSLWWLVNKEPKYKDLKVGILEDDARWNFYSKYKYEHNKDPVVLRHYSSSGAKQLDF